MVRCTECGSEVGDAQLDRDLMLAECGSCGAVFSYAEQAGLAEDVVMERLSANPVLGGAPPPEGVTMAVEGDQLVVRYRWYRATHLFLIVMAVAMAAIIGFVFTSTTDLASVSWVFVVHGVMMAGFLYWGVAHVVNSTVVRVGSGQLSVKHGPMPWLGNRTVGSGDLDQLFVEKIRRKSKNSVHYVYHLSAKTRDGQRIRLVKAFPKAVLARFMEQEVEQYLGIEDRKVEGEHRGD